MHPYLRRQCPHRFEPVSAPTDGSSRRSGSAGASRSWTTTTSTFGRTPAWTTLKTGVDDPALIAVVADALGEKYVVELDT
jgi:hypothetical protein